MSGVEATPRRAEAEAVVTAARAGDESAFAALVEGHRRELQVHCYRMLGSFQDAEDLVQETFLRAWRGRGGFQGRSSFRAWLYRIATNACLDALQRRPPRVLPPQVAPAADPRVPPLSTADLPWLQPYPDRLLEGIAPPDAEPDAALVAKETIELAFLAAIQHLTARQRAVLILRDVLGWSATQTAVLLDASVDAVNSALRRARSTLKRHLPARRLEWAPGSDPTPQERSLLRRYMAAHERADPAALAALLREDARLTMPPTTTWYDGRAAVVTFHARLFAARYQWRLLVTRANRVAGFLVTMGTLGDRIGRRRLLLLGAAAFGVASTIAALSTSAEQLIAARALLGVAGATLAPSTLALLRNMFADPRQRTVAISVWIASFSAGGAVGPLAGGLLLERYWWGSVFLLAVPPMALLLVLGPRVLPEYRDPAPGRLDLASAALSLAAVLAVVYGLKQLAQDGLGWPPALAILAGLAVGVGFVRRQRRLAEPLLDLRLFANRAFSAALATNTLSFFVAFGAFLFIAQYLQLVLGLSPLRAGLWTAPSGAGFIVGSMLTPLLARRARPALVMAGGLALAAVGFGLLTQLDGSWGLAVLVTGAVVLSLGLAPVFTLATDLAVGAAPPARAGAASAVSETSSELGGALGIAVLGSVATAVYRGQITGAVPAGVPAGAAAAARDTLGGALAAAARLPGRLGVELLDAARQAFTQGVQLTFTASAAIAVGIAILVVSLLRGVGAGPGSEERPEPSQGDGCCAGKVGAVKIPRPRSPRRGSDEAARATRPAGSVHKTDEQGVFRGGPKMAWFKDPAGNILSVLEEG